MIVAGVFGASITYISTRAPAHRMAEIIGMLGTSGFVGMVAGTMLVSLRETPVRGVFRPSWGLPILLGAGLFVGLAFFAGKYALTDLSVWTVFAVQQIGNVVAFTVFARPRVWRQLWAVLRRPGLPVGPWEIEDMWAFWALASAASRVKSG